MIKYIVLLLIFSPISLFARILTPVSELSLLSYSVTQNGATEKPFDNAYWDNHEAWIYVDIITWTPLFSSRDKYDSGTGWPTFSRPIHPSVLLYRDDMSSWELRKEVLSRRSQAHLWHLFDDGPSIYRWVRYCMNSAALRFIPRETMKGEGYGNYLRFVP